MKRMAHAGFTTEFVRSAILPEWWANSCSEDPTLLQDVEIRLARFLGLPLAMIKDPNIALAPLVYPAAQLRRVREVDRNRLRPAIHSAVRIAECVVRNLRNGKSETSVPPTDPLAWRSLIEPVGGAVTLDDVISDLWKRSIPVVPVDMLPIPGFQGMCCIVETRPVILLGHKHDEPGRVAFVVAHEVGHVTASDCAPDRPVVDEEDEITDDAEIERRADQYATNFLIGSDTVPQIDAVNFKDLARDASKLEREIGADASMVIFAWARRTGDYTMATMAVKALYRHLGARQQLYDLFNRHVDVSAAAETDRALLRCVYAEPERNEAVG